MPKVGDKKFSYDKKGIEEAKEYAKNTGQDLKMYYGGGMVDARNRSEIYQEGGIIENMGKDDIEALKFYGEYEKGGKVKSKKK